MEVPEIDVEELEGRHAAGAVVFDVREPDEYEDAHVPEAIPVPLATVPDRLGDFPTDATGLPDLRRRRSQPARGRSSSGPTGSTPSTSPAARRRGSRPASPTNAARPPAELPVTEPRLVTTAAALDDLVAILVDEPRYAVDTEFHRERTYYPKVALVQVAWDGGIALIDPLAVSLEPLAQGAAPAPVSPCCTPRRQDLEVLDLACGATPTRLFDTQLAAGFCGMSTPSLASLADRDLRIRLPKGDRLTDWLARPLTDDQLAYAAADVAHLLALHDRLVERLDALGRLEWAEDECEELRLRGRPIA